MNKLALKMTLATTLLATASLSAGIMPAMAASGSSNPPLTIVGNEEAAWQDNFSPYTANNVQYGLGTIYQSLFYFSTTGPQYNLLGTGFKWSDGNKTLTVSIRKGVKFSNGTPLTAQDVVFSYDMLKKYPALDLNLVWSEISSVKANGDYAVQFQFQKVNVPYAQILLSQIAIVPKSIWSKQPDPSKWTDPNPVGTGPYVLDKFTSQNYSLKANPMYWGGTPAAPVINFPALAGNDSADLQLSAGNLDWAGLFIPNIKNVYVAKDPANNHYYFPDNGTVSIYPNLKNPLLADLAVRKAMSLAINRNQIYKVGEYGYEPPASPSGLTLPAQQQWLGSGVPKAFAAPNVKEANAILNKAGYKMNSDGIRVKNGRKLEFNLIAPAGWTDWNADEGLIASDLKQIGIMINVQEPQQADWQAQLSGHTFDLALEGAFVAVGSTPYYGYFNALDPKGSSNYEGYDNASTTAALSVFKSSVSVAQEKAAMGRIEQSVVANLPVIPLVGAANWYEYSSKGYTGWPSASNDYVDAPPYTAYAIGIVLMHLKPAH